MKFDLKEAGAIKKLILKEPIDTEKMIEKVDFEKEVEDKEVIKEIKRFVEKKAGNIIWVLDTQNVTPEDKEGLGGYLETLKSILTKIEAYQKASEIKEEDVK